MNEENVLQSQAMFIGLVSMFAQAVMQHLGKLADPMSGKVEKNLEAAKSTIDLIQILKEKTKGNLNPEEEKFLKTTLMNLQLNYVEEMESAQKENQKEKVN